MIMNKNTVNQHHDKLCESCVTCLTKTLKWRSVWVEFHLEIGPVFLVHISDSEFVWTGLYFLSFTWWCTPVKFLYLYLTSEARMGLSPFKSHSFLLMFSFINVILCFIIRCAVIFTLQRRKSDLCVMRDILTDLNIVHILSNQYSNGLWIEGA